MKKTLRKVEVTQQDVWDASRPTVERNKKKYTRKRKHKKDSDE
jgi:hypothetical protein